MIGINEVFDLFHSTSISLLEDIHYLFNALKNKITILNLHSCTLNRGHGLETILKMISSFTNLTKLHLEGWQIDRISASTLMKSLQHHHHQSKKSLQFLSLKSCIFLGVEHTFYEISNGLKHIKQLNTLDLSYCNLGDNEIITLVDAIKDHPNNIECVNLEKNCCQMQSSVSAIANWIGESQCKVRNLNIRALFMGYSDEGLLQRQIDPIPIFYAFSRNTSLYGI